MVSFKNLNNIRKNALKEQRLHNFLGRLALEMKGIRRKFDEFLFSTARDTFNDVGMPVFFSGDAGFCSCPPFPLVFKESTTLNRFSQVSNSSNHLKLPHSKPTLSNLPFTLSILPLDSSPKQPLSLVGSLLERYNTTKYQSNTLISFSISS